MRYFLFEIHLAGWWEFQLSFVVSIGWPFIPKFQAYRFPLVGNMDHFSKFHLLFHCLAIFVFVFFQVPEKNKKLGRPYYSSSPGFQQKNKGVVFCSGQRQKGPGGAAPGHRRLPAAPRLPPGPGPALRAGPRRAALRPRRAAGGGRSRLGGGFCEVLD